MNARGRAPAADSVFAPGNGGLIKTPDAGQAGMDGSLRRDKESGSNLRTVSELSAPSFASFSEIGDYPTTARSPAFCSSPGSSRWRRRLIVTGTSCRNGSPPGLSGREQRLLAKRLRGKPVTKGRARMESVRRLTFGFPAAPFAPKRPSRRRATGYPPFHLAISSSRAHSRAHCSFVGR